MSEPHPTRRRHALFSLKPRNKRAEQVVAHPNNQHLVRKSADGTSVLDIGFHIRSKSCHTIATLGRGDTDIFIEGTSIAKVQCSFEIEPTTDVIMLYDRSHGQTTQVFGDNATPFENGRVRKILVQKKLNSVVGMGGKRYDLVQFELQWHQHPTEVAEMIKNRESLAQEYGENPRLARTIDETETILPSQRQTRIHTPGLQQLRMRYTKVAILGSGQFGVVYKAVDVDTGRPLAVKILRQPAPASKEEEWKQSVYYALKREVETLSRISHPHIIDYITSQGWDGPSIEIFMGLKDGTLRSLVTNGIFSSINNLAHCVIHQMLQALDFLAAHGIVHRDVKPENILYTSLPESYYQFQLSDFGLCNRAVSAVTSVGSPLYMAPEIFQSGSQSHKVDVWSLFVTMIWTLDIEGFRQNSEQLKSIQHVHQAVSDAASKVEVIREMARTDPNKRASAAQMLVKCFGGGRPCNFQESGSTSQHRKI